MKFARPAEEEPVLKRSRRALASILIGIGVGIAWFTWLGPTCRLAHGTLANLAFAALLVTAAVVIADRVHAWQTQPSNGSIGYDILMFWLIVLCIIVASFIWTLEHPSCVG